jgi:hypothetical protein
LNSAGLALHHRQCGGRAEVAQPEHRAPSVTTATVLRLIVRRRRVLRVLRDRQTDPGDPRVYARESSSRVRSAIFGRHLELAAEVQQERPVADLADLDRRQVLQRLRHLGRVGRVGGVAGAGRRRS